MAAKGPGLTVPGDQSDGGAADASADMGEHGTNPSGERCHSTNQPDLRAAGHPPAFHITKPGLFSPCLADMESHLDAHVLS